jgi:hypothetical protein
MLRVDSQPLRPLTYPFMLSSILFFTSTVSGARCRGGTVSGDCIPGSGMLGLRPGINPPDPLACRTFLSHHFQIQMDHVVDQMLS